MANLDISDSDFRELDNDAGGNIPSSVETVPFVSRMEENTWADEEFDEDDEEEDEDESDPAGEPPAAVIPVTAAPAATPPTDAAPPAKAEPVAPPTEWNEWPLNEDGSDLYLDVCELPETHPDVIAFREQVGEAAFVRLLGDYQRAKTNYAQVVEASDTATIRQYSTSFAESAEQTRSAIREMFAPLGEEESGALLADYDRKAGELLTAARDGLVAQYMQSGVAQNVAVRRAAKEILSPPEPGQPSAYEQALAMAIAGDLKAFIQRLLPAAAGGAPGAKGAAAQKQPPAQTPTTTPRTAPSPPPPALSTPSASKPAPVAGARATRAPAAVSDDGAAILKQLGKTPEEYAAWRARAMEA